MPTPPLAKLYDDLSGTVYGLATKLCETPADAAALCTSVFDHLSTHYAEYDASHLTLTQWATQVTHRLALMSAPDAQVVHQRAAALLATCVHPSPDSQALADAYFGGLTYQEIARRNGTTPTQVCRTLNSTLRQLS